MASLPGPVPGSSEIDSPRAHEISTRSIYDLQKLKERIPIILAGEKNSQPGMKGRSFAFIDSGRGQKTSTES